MKETLRHKEAFEYYYSLDKGRNLSSVAVQFKVSERSVAKWSKNFNWQTRLEQRDIENGKRLEKKTDKNVVNSKADYRELIRQTVEIYKQRLIDGKIIINRPQDLETLVKLDLNLMGEASEITDDKSVHELVEEFRKVLSPEDVKKYIKQISESK